MNFFSHKCRPRRFRKQQNIMNDTFHHCLMETQCDKWYLRFCYRARLSWEQDIPQEKICNARVCNKLLISFCLHSLARSFTRFLDPSSNMTSYWKASTDAIMLSKWTASSLCLLLVIDFMFPLYSRLVMLQRRASNNEHHKIKWFVMQVKLNYFLHRKKQKPTTTTTGINWTWEHVIFILNILSFKELPVI